MAKISRYEIEHSHELYRSSFEFQGLGVLLLITSHALANSNSIMPCPDKNLEIFDFSDRGSKGTFRGPGAWREQR